MRGRVVSFGVIATLVASTAFAGPGIRESIPAAVAREVAAQNQRGRGENPMLVPGLVLIGGGAGLALLAVLNPTSVECSETSSSFECGTKANKALLFSGLGAAALGGVLIMRGNRQSNAPSIVTTPGGVAVQQRIRF